MTKKEQKLVEITRRFSYKLNVGNYESRDFFCAQKAECLESEADEMSQRLHDFCRRQVIKDVTAYLREKQQQQQSNAYDLAKRGSIMAKQLDNEHVEQANGAYENEQ